MGDRLRSLVVNIFVFHVYTYVLYLYTHNVLFVLLFQYTNTMFAAGPQRPEMSHARARAQGRYGPLRAVSPESPETFLEDGGFMEFNE